MRDLVSCRRALLLGALCVIAPRPAHRPPPAAPAAARPTQPSTRRALLVGIDHYAYPALADRWRANAQREWGVALAGGPRANPGVRVERRSTITDLSGPVNDVTAVAQLLRVRYAFDDVRLLTDSAATRDGILDAIRQLVDRSQPGEVVVFYYAGHGSQRLNSRAPASASAAHMDQTIVPADANVGQFDIRNVELNQLFDRLLAKNVALTLIFDSCHSGAAVRGLTMAERARLAPFDLRDADDSTDVQPIAGRERSNPALFLAAAQESQLASEDSAADPVDGQVHGVFTRALLDVLRDAAVDQNLPAQDVFKQVQAIMRWRGATQVPVLAGIDRNPARPMFGLVAGSRADRLTMAYQGITKGLAILDGGAVLGVGAGSQLVAGSGADTVRVELTGRGTLTTSQARVVHGDAAKLRPGTLFRLDASTFASDMPLRAWIPPVAPAARLTTDLAALGALRSSGKVEWIADPTTIPDDGRPLYTVRFDGARWTVLLPSGKSARLASASAASVVAAIAADRGAVARDAVAPPRVFVLVPPSLELRHALHLDGNPAGIDPSPAPVADGYALFGQLRDDGSIAYAWVRPNATEASQRSSPFPARTDWVALPPGRAPSDSAVSTLESLATSLGTLTFWLTASPHDAGIFSYTLGLRGADPGHDVDKFAGDTVADVGGETYGLVLRKPPTDQRVGDQRYVYVFAIDSHGEGTLLFGQSRNQLPALDASNRLITDSVITLPIAPFTICPPYGVDTFVMVASAEPIPNPMSVFHLEGVRHERGIQAGTLPTNWTIRRLAIPSVAPPAGSKLAQTVSESCN